MILHMSSRQGNYITLGVMKPVEMQVYVGRDSLNKYVKVLGGTKPLFYLGHLSGWRCGGFGEGKGDLGSLLNPGFTNCWDTARQFPWWENRAVCGPDHDQAVFS